MAQQHGLVAQSRHCATFRLMFKAIFCYPSLKVKCPSGVNFYLWSLKGAHILFILNTCATVGTFYGNFETQNLLS